LNHSLPRTDALVEPQTNGRQIEEVKGVVQVLDQEEEIALHEFAKFEEKLKQQKGPGATVGAGSLDTAPG
jgi:hypothetical protein